MHTRRAFPPTSAATTVAAFAGPTDALAAMHDLAIREGRVVDPARRLDAVMECGDLGTLGAGAPADLTGLELRGSEFEFVFRRPS